ncbi:MAG: hypothetical protein BWK76_09085 [Desulfobulbaceae bacterium A2]|nr:MAG: hypothetical protein BWK76_09085 [Desulfobulbaceae bacterium A2]
MISFPGKYGRWTGHFFRQLWAGSIRRQLILGITLVHAVLMTIFVVDLVSRQRVFLHQQSLRSTLALAQSLAANSVSWVLAGDVVGLEEVVRSQRDFPGLRYAMILSPEGRVLGHSEDQHTGLYVSDPVSLSLLEGTPTIRQLVEDPGVVDMAAPIYANERLIGWARVAISREEISSGLKNITRDGLWYTFFAIALGSVFALFMARGLTRALNHLVQVAERIRGGDDQVRSQLDRPDELGRLSETLNATLDTVVAQKQELLTARRDQDRTLQELQKTVRSMEEVNECLNMEVELRRQTEEYLAKEKEQLAVTLASIAEGVITTDLTGRVILLNRVAAALTGWSQEEATGLPLAEIFRVVTMDGSSPCADPFQRILEQGRIANTGGDLQLVARDGSRRAIAETGAPIRDARLRTIGIVLVFRDATAEHQIHEQIFKMRKLESVGVLAGGIAHDFNNMLTGILGNLNLARIYLPMDNQARPLLDSAEQASLRARALTQQLLTFSKGGEPVRQQASLAELIRETCDFVLAGSSIRVQLDLAPDLAPAAIDKGQIGQVLQNILLNAIQAMPGGGIIQLRAENHHHTPDAPLALPTGDYVKVTVQDNGVGIPAEYLPRIFDPYFTTKQHGSGLGLAITHSIISKHEGLIQAESTPGKGTTLTFYLPSRPAAPGVQATAITHAEDQLCAASGSRVLIMDDEPMIREVAGKMLERAGYEVLYAVDGEEALAQYRTGMEISHPIDLVIMDLTIPGGMGGQEAVGKLMALDPAARVIVSSGYANDPVMSRYQDYGFLGCIGKPYEMQSLLDEVARVLRLTRRN